MVTVKELIAELQKYDPDLPVIASADDEGNRYHAVYMPGEAYCPELDSYMIKEVVPKEYFDEHEDAEVNCLVM